MLLVTPQGLVTHVDEQDAETLLREQEAVGQIVNLHVVTEELDFMVVMGIDPIQSVNSTARQLVDNLSAVHVLCFGPVAIVGLDADLEREVAGP